MLGSRLRFRKQLKRIVSKQPKLIYGCLGFLSKESGILSSTVLEQVISTIKRKSAKGTRVLLRTTVDHTLTKKPNEVRMGKGKGSIWGYGAKIKKGSIFLEVIGPSQIALKKILKSAGLKLPLKVDIIDNMFIRKS